MFAIPTQVFNKTNGVKAHYTYVLSTSQNQFSVTSSTLAVYNGINLLFFSKGYCIWELLHTSLTLWICEVNETIFLLTRKKYFCKNQNIENRPRNMTKVQKKH
jgi:hypothetical protein